MNFSLIVAAFPDFQTFGLIFNCIFGQLVTIKHDTSATLGGAQQK